MYIVVDTRSSLPPIMPSGMHTSQITRETLTGEERSTAVAALSATLSNVRSSLEMFTNSQIDVAEDSKILSITPTSVKLIVDSTDRTSVKKRINALRTSKHLMLSEAQPTTTQDSKLLSKSISAFRRWSKKNRATSVIIFTLYVPVLDRALERCLRECDTCEINIHFVIFNDDCMLDTNTFNQQLSERAFGANIVVSNTFSDPGEILTIVRHGLIPLLPRWDISIRVSGEGDHEIGSDSDEDMTQTDGNVLRLVCTPALLTATSKATTTAAATTAVQRASSHLVGVRRILLGSVSPEYLSDMHHVLPAQDQETLEDRNASADHFNSLLKSLRSDDVDTAGLGLLLEDRSHANQQYLLVSAASLPGSVAGVLFSLLDFINIAPRPRDVMKSSFSTSTSSTVVRSLSSLPLTNYDALAYAVEFTTLRKTSSHEH